MEVVQQAVADHSAVSAGQAVIGQQVLSETQATLQRRLTRQGGTGERQHGGCTIHTQHGGSGVVLGEAKADVARPAAEIDQMVAEAGGKELLQPVDQSLIADAEISAGVGERLLLIVHQLRFGDAIHGDRANGDQCGQRTKAMRPIRTPPLAPDRPCRPHWWRYGAETAQGHPIP